MSLRVTFLHRYMSPFMAGVCMAGATVTSEVALAAALFVGGAGFAFASLPAGGRMIARMAGGAD